MTILSGADLVLPGQVLAGGSVVIEGDRIVDVQDRPRAGGEDLSRHLVLPGFIDVHVHGLYGLDALDDSDSVAAMARLLPRFGVTSFCPTSIACSPDDLSRMLAAIGRARAAPQAASRVLPAHLESNFINPEYKGAQPEECLRRPRETATDGTFSGRDILDVIAAARSEVGILTIAPELDGAIDLIADLVAQGHYVSLGHSGATFEQALAGIAAGATQATHLFNRMPPLGHRVPGLAGAVLAREELAAEVICDGVHVHPAMLKMAVAAKRPERIMAVTDATAGAGLPRGSQAQLGGRRINIGDAAYLEDGTIAGSVLTMDRAFSMLVQQVGLSVPEAAVACSTTAARELALDGFGVIAPGAVADLVVMDQSFRVVRTYIGGRLIYPEKGRTP
jgi:N-acetylglucosamine-6-phosphate deacetylase